MKKIYIIAAAALALAACSKTEVFAPVAGEIDFAPNALSTKALIEAGEFPTDQTFSVFAFADLDGTGSDYTTDYTSPVMNDVEISYHTVGTSGDWKAKQGTYLWPATGTVDFYAYYPSTLTATFDVSSNHKHLELSGVNLGNAIGQQNEPLVASILGQMRQRVQLVFKHTVSQIAVTAFDATETAALQGKLSIKKVEFVNMKTTGRYVDGTTSGAGEWLEVNGSSSFVPFQGNKKLETTENYLSNNSFSNSFDGSAAFVVIPEDIINDVTTGQAIKVTYSYPAFSWNDFDYPAAEETVIVPLYGRVSSFDNGKRYVFHLGISMDGANNEIMFSPSVDGWETIDVSGITIDALNVDLL